MTYVIISAMSQPAEDQQQEQANSSDVNQSTTLTKKSILIRPDNAKDMEDFIYISNYKAGAKYRQIISELAKKYGFSEKDYKHGKISISLDFAALKAEQQAQENKNSEGI
jgi:hypothetical protein